MKIELDISQNLVPQFQEQFKMQGKAMNPHIGSGKMHYRELPRGLEFYHFTPSKSKVSMEMISINPSESRWYLVHLNLGKDKQQKQVGGKLIEFHRFLPSGILIYCPGLEIRTQFPKAFESELATFRFSKSFMDDYFDKQVIPVGQTIIYEDLDYRTEQGIRKVISHMGHKMNCHASALQVLSRIFQKIERHEKVVGADKLHSKDIKSLFLVSAHLRNPTTDNVPSVAQLADMAKMSASKFKLTFKQLFGSAPKQYRNKIRMEYAREELRSKRKAPAEVSSELGYSHPSNFTSAYKRHFNELPSVVYGQLAL